MPSTYCYKYPRPAVTVDLLVFSVADDSLRVLLVRRKNPPFAGSWAAPGGFLEIDEPIETGARRELREETGLELAAPLEVIGVFGKPGRDPRGRTISIAHAAAIAAPLSEVRGGDDAGEAAWRDPRQPLELAFDHHAILAAGLSWLVTGVLERDLALALLPDRFDLDAVRSVHRAVLGHARHVAGWLGRMERTGLVRTRSGRPGRFRKARD